VIILEQINQYFKKLGVTPVREVTEQALSSIYTAINSYTGTTNFKDEYIAAIFSERLGGFYLNNWELPSDQKKLRDALKETIVMYFKKSGPEGGIDFYFERFDESIIKQFRETYLFSYLEQTNASAALRWYFIAEKEKRELIRQTIYHYALDIVTKQDIFKKLSTDFSEVVRAEMNNAGF